MKHIHLDLQDLNRIVITEISRGTSREDMVMFLRKRGWPEDAARKFVANAMRQQTRLDYAAREAARETDQHDPFVVNDEQQKAQYAWVIAAIGLALIAISAVTMLAGH